MPALRFRNVIFGVDNKSIVHPKLTALEALIYKALQKSKP